MSDRMDAMDARIEGLEGGFANFKNSMFEMSRVIGEEMGRFLGKRTVNNGGNEVEGGGPSSGSNEAPRSTDVTDKLEEFRLSAKKVELPTFDGKDPVAWITRAETYFEVQRTSEDVRIQLAKLSMEGGTIYWFNCWRESKDEPSWEKLKYTLLVRFGMGRLGNPYEELRDIKQTGTVNEYIAEFEVFYSECGRLPEVQFLGYFVGGLKLEIRARIHTLKPLNRHQALQTARDVETELRTLLKLEEEDDAQRGRYWASGSGRYSRGGVGLGLKAPGSEIGPKPVQWSRGWVIRRWVFECFIYSKTNARHWEFILALG